MKRSTIAFIVTGIVVVTAAMWYFNTDFSSSWGDNSQFVVILILAIFGGIMGYRRLTSEKRGEPAEDEMSKRLLQKASSMSFYISLYLWVAIMYFDGKNIVETEVLFGWGILGMGVIFAICWVVFRFVGIRNE